MSIGIFGGTFDPPTKGHKYVIDEALKCVDQLFLVPAFSPVHSKIPMFQFHQRILLLSALREGFSEKDQDRVFVSGIERDIAYGNNQLLGVSTWSLMNEFAEHYQKNHLFFVCGDDVGDNIRYFINGRKLLKSFLFLVIPSPQSFVLQRSTDVRNSLIEGDGLWREMVPPEVCDTLSGLDFDGI